MAGADDGYFPKPEKKNPVFGNGRQGTPYFEEDGAARSASAAFGGLSQQSQQPHQLQLEEDVRLPWLEGDDDGYEEARSGIGQGVILGALGLVALAVIGGGVIWAIKSRPDQPLVADGGVITAPKAPYKVKPENPGGEVVEGTGDTSFAVAEGQSRPVQIDRRDDAPAPGFSTPTTEAARPAAATPEAKPQEAAPVVSGVGVQVGAYANKAAAEAGWNTLKTQYEPLAGMSHRVVQGKADIGTVYRLQAVPGDAAAARALCAGMKGVGMSCQVKN
ncbi:SPOR domain-containing protein [Novosphingobium guangzhouense]|uniref:Sporulation protein n=1 Tax=Novosphingobium guangzhouense TaxID=1850347 RepID=A0A2K2FZQ7_9SPHN|nr:SPOR domain-containing protein [Novosphingobium guangzhouense]PNU04271.1 sporulation protein [Novosphingobium guangzhouense]